MEWRTSQQDKSDSRRPWTITVSFLAQCLLVCLGILVPLLGTEEPVLRDWLPVTLIPPRERVPAVSAQNVKTAGAASSTALRFHGDFAPASAEVLPVATSVAVDGPVPVAVPAWASGGLPGGVLPGFEPPPPPPKRPSLEKREPAREQAPIRVGGDVQAARLIRKVSPAYPSLARQARVSGVVRLEAVIDLEGAIQKLRVLGGHPLLVASALDAVRQWRYRPTLLNGKPVPVITYIDVNFTLTER